MLDVWESIILWVSAYLIVALPLAMLLGSIMRTMTSDEVIAGKQMTGKNALSAAAQGEAARYSQPHTLIQFPQPLGAFDKNVTATAKARRPVNS